MLSTTSSSCGCRWWTTRCRLSMTASKPGISGATCPRGCRRRQSNAGALRVEQWPERRGRAAAHRRDRARGGGGRAICCSADDDRSLGHRRLRRRDGSQERAGLPEGRRVGAGRGDAARRRPRPRTTPDATACRAGTRTPRRWSTIPRSTPSTWRRRRRRTSDTPCSPRGRASRSTSRSRWRSTTPSAAPMIAACAAAGVPLFTAYYRRALPRFARSRSCWTPARSAPCGSPRVASIAPSRRRRARCRGASIRPSRAAASSWTSPRTSSICWTTSSARSRDVSRRGGQPGRPLCRRGHRHRRRSPGARVCAASALWCFSASGDVDRTEIVGTRGRILYATFSDAPVVLETDAGTSRSSFPSPPTSSSR